MVNFFTYSSYFAGDDLVWEHELTLFFGTDLRFISLIKQTLFDSRRAQFYKTNLNSLRYNNINNIFYY